jgi:hypothetical protein
MYYQLSSSAIFDKFETFDIAGFLHDAQHGTKQFTRGLDDAFRFSGISGILQGAHPVCYWI